MPKPKSNWKFDWKSLYSKNSLVFKLSYEEEIQGLLKMAKVDEGYYEMSNLEISPKNYGSKGKLSNIAGSLIAYACLLTFELNNENYKGYLAFTSKGELIPHYEKHYFAELVFREKMIIFPVNGKKVIKKYLNLKTQIMANNIELIGIQSNKINKSEAEIIKRIIEAHSKSQSKDEIIENKMIGIKFSLNKYLSGKIDAKIIEAGNFLNDILKIYNIKKNRFARYIGLSEPNLHALLKGRRKINNDIARKLELIFGIDAQAWLYIETKNEIKKFNSANKISNNDYSIGGLVG